MRSARLHVIDPAANRRSHYDPRHYFFERNSRTPYGAFDSTPAWMPTKRWRWGAITVLVLALLGAIAVHSDRPDQTIHATARTAR